VWLLVEGVIGMIVVGWNNGSPKDRSGGGYGIKIGWKDRDNHFGKTWTSGAIELENEEVVNVTLSPSFWRCCPELRRARIGKWMLDNELAPWPKGTPPRLKLEPIGDRRFRLSRL